MLVNLKQMASTDATLDMYKSQAKAIVKKVWNSLIFFFFLYWINPPCWSAIQQQLHSRSPSRMSVEAGQVCRRHLDNHPKSVVFLCVLVLYFFSFVSSMRLQVSFNYVIEDGIIFLMMADAGYPKKLCFSFLADVHRHLVDELSREYGDKWGCLWLRCLISFLSVFFRA